MVKKEGVTAKTALHGNLLTAAVLARSVATRRIAALKESVPTVKTANALVVPTAALVVKDTREWSS